MGRGSRATEAKGSIPNKAFEWSEIRKHSTPRDGWLVVDGVVRRIAKTF